MNNKCRERKNYYTNNEVGTYNNADSTHNFFSIVIAQTNKNTKRQQMQKYLPIDSTHIFIHLFEWEPIKIQENNK